MVDPVRLVASSIFLMPENVVKQSATGREMVGRPAIPFFVIETVPGEYWLFRDNGYCCDAADSFQFRLRKGELALPYARFYRRIAKLDGSVSGIKTELGPNESVDVIIEMPGREPQRLNFEAAFVPVP